MLEVENYQLGDIVRVTIVIEEGVDKNEVIQNLKQMMKDEKSFRVHNPNLSDNTFTIQIEYGKVEKINEIEGIKSVTVTKKVELHEDSSNNEQTISQEIEKPKQDIFFNKPEVILIGVIALGALVYVGIKKKERFRGSMHF